MVVPGMHTRNTAHSLPRHTDTYHTPVRALVYAQVHAVSHIHINGEKNFATAPPPLPPPSCRLPSRGFDTPACVPPSSPTRPVTFFIHTLSPSHLLSPSSMSLVILQATEYSAEQGEPISAKKISLFCDKFAVRASHLRVPPNHACRLTNAPTRRRTTHSLPTAHYQRTHTHTHAFSTSSKSISNQGRSMQ